MDKIKYNKILKRIISVTLCIALLVTGIQVSNLVNKDISGLNENNKSESIKEEVSSTDANTKKETEVSDTGIIVVDSVDKLAEEISVVQSSETEPTAEISEEDATFSTKRLIVISDKDFDAYNASSTIQYDNLFILTYDDYNTCKNAFELLQENKDIISVEVDSVMDTEENEEDCLEEEELSEYENSLNDILAESLAASKKEDTKLKKYIDSIIPKKEIKVAILDTGLSSDIKNDRVIDTNINYSNSGEANSTEDDNGHGTQIATLILDNTNSSVKVAPIKVADNNGKSTILNTYMGIKYAIENNYDVINISMNAYTSSMSKILTDIIDEASTKGIFVVVSAGNNSSNVENITPSNIESAIVVSATDNNNVFAEYSNFGKTIDYSACGVYDKKTGTSYAAANVTAIISNVLSAGDSIDVLDDYAIDLGDEEQKGFDYFYGKGYLGYTYNKNVQTYVDKLLEDLSSSAGELYVQKGDSSFDITKEFGNITYNSDYYKLQYVKSEPEFNINKEGSYLTYYEFVSKENQDKNYEISRTIEVIDDQEFVDYVNSLSTSATTSVAKSGSGKVYTAYSVHEDYPSRMYGDSKHLYVSNARAYLALSGLITCAQKVKDGTTTWSAINKYGKAMVEETTLPAKPSGVDAWKCVLAYEYKEYYESGYGIAQSSLTEEILKDIRNSVVNINSAGKTAASAYEDDNYASYFSNEKRYEAFCDAYVCFSTIFGGDYSASGKAVLTGKGPGYGTSYTDAPKQSDYSKYSDYVDAVKADTKANKGSGGSSAEYVPIVTNIYLHKGDTISFKMKGKSCSHVGVIGDVWRSGASSSTITYDAINQQTKAGTLTIYNTSENSQASVSYTATADGYYTFDCSGIAYACKYASIYITTTSEYEIYVTTYKITLNNQSATTAGTTAFFEKNKYGIYSSEAATTAISSITKPTKTGYTFYGYYKSVSNNNTTSATGTTQVIDANGNITSTYKSGTGFGADTTIYALWKPTLYTVNYIDRIKGTNIQLGSSTASKSYGSTVKGSDKGTDTSDNKYYNGYYYDSCTTATVGTSGATVYRDFVLRTTNKTATINWSDVNNKFKSRPLSVVLHLYANGVEDTGKKATVIGVSATSSTNSNQWIYTFSGVAKYSTVNGSEIPYTVGEDTPTSLNKAMKYSVSKSSDTWIITNIADRNNMPEDKEKYGAVVSGTINWSDYDNKYDWRPESVTITLYRDGVKCGNSQIINKGTNTYSFTGLDLINPNTFEAYNYSVVESPVTYYSTNYGTMSQTNEALTDTDGSTYYKTKYTIDITNTFVPPKFTITLDKNNADATGTAGTTNYCEYFSIGNYTNTSCNTAITTITKPSRVGFTFKGYYKSVGGSDKAPVGNTSYIDENGDITATDTTFRKDTTIYAMWQRNKYTVTYDYSYNGGSSATKTTDSVFYEDPIDFSPIATKVGDTGTYTQDNSDGWEFIGWNTDKNATTAMTSMDMPAKNVTLYAIYKKTVNFKEIQLDGTKYNPQDNYYEVFNNDTTATHKLLSSPTKCTVDDSTEAQNEWYAIGWTTSTSGKSGLKNLGATVTSTEDVIYYAVYERDLYVYFVDMNETTQKTTTLTNKQVLNSYTTSNFVTPSFTTPNAHTFTYDPVNGAWTFAGWTKDTKTTSSLLVSAGATVKNDANHVYYYALYKRNLTATFVDYKGTTKTTTPITAEQKANANNASKINSTTIIIPNINTYTGWDAIEWADAPDSLEIALNQGNSFTVTKNATYYALYERTVYANFYRAGSTTPESLSDVQKANASDINGTKTAVILNSPLIGTYKDSNNLTWAGKYWSLKKTKDAPNDLALNTQFSIKDDTDYYGVYSTNYTATFVSVNNSTSNKQYVSTTVYANANNMSDITEGKVTAPSLKICKYGGHTWTAEGWTSSNTALNISISVGDEITIPDNNQVFYGVYKSAYTATFIDYDGINQRKRIVDVATKINSSNITPVITESKSPAIGIYNDGKSDWIIKGWTTSKDANATTEIESEASFKINTNTTFYATYKRDVLINLVDFVSNASHTSQQKAGITTNSYAITYTSFAEFTIPAQNGYTTNGKTWNAVGWATAPTNTSLSNVKYYSLEKITTNEDMTLYAMYTKDITVTYDGNGGTNLPSSTGTKVTNASGATANPSIKITESKPTRTSLLFANKWLSGIKSGTEYISGQTYTFTDDTTLYAQWILETVDMKATINWVDNENIMNSRPEFIRLSVYRDGQKISSYLVSNLDDTISAPITNNTIPSDGLRVTVSKTGTVTEYTFTGLQKYNPYNGTSYNYTLVQETFVSENAEVNYSTTYSADTWTVTNTMVDANNKSITGTIYWYDDSNAWHFRPSNVTLTLLKTDPDTGSVTKQTKTVKVEATDSMVYLFDKQAAVNTKKNPYIYEVVLGTVPLYTTRTDKISDEVFNFECSLTKMPGGYTGREGNRLTIAADAFNWKGNVAKADDYFATATNEEMSVLVTLKTIKKTWTGTGTNKHEVWDNNVYMTDSNGDVVEYNVIVTPEKNTQVDYLPDGRYELVVHDSSLFDFDKFAAAAYELNNATVTEENGRYFITFEAKYESSSILNLHAQVILKGWRGYTSIKEYMYQPVHVFGDEWVYGDPASCVEDGFKYHVCVLCGARSSQGEIVPAYGHTFVNGVCQECGAIQK